MAWHIYRHDPQAGFVFSCEERTKGSNADKPLLYGASAPYGDEVEWSDLKNLRIIGLSDRDALIATKDATGRIVATEMFRFFANKIEKHRPALVIVDSLYDIYGGDETRAHRSGNSSACCAALGKFECALIVLGHPSLYGMASGTGTSGSGPEAGAMRFAGCSDEKRNEKTGIGTHTIKSVKGNYSEPDASI